MLLKGQLWQLQYNFSRDVNISMFGKGRAECPLHDIYVYLCLTTLGRRSRDGVAGVMSYYVGHRSRNRGAAYGVTLMYEKADAEKGRNGSGWTGRGRLGADLNHQSSGFELSANEDLNGQ
ncbi:uncharacterized protein CLUP02_03885 [Colletotrichum lupini]|uniref:Uncharacterized protein n=1 Tax=Colletotrichum lupini TaxID=145971 RepID=A0A9Q8SJQ3_9PEZI|nr:uncharacterized protein CLUP02_03885 [Colletotrichum lupini]UQC78408.1 hypothetical protein CLUP02_03885 [Colletotrichum lupini]